MDFKYTFQQTNAYAMQFGLILGLLWIGGFLAFVFSFSTPSLQTLYMFCTFFLPVMAWQLTRTFRKRACNNVLSFGRGYLFSFLLYFYAGILLTAGFYAYFEFADNGFFVESYRNYLERPEVKAMLDTPEMKQTVDAMLNGGSLSETLDIFQETPLIYIALNVMNVSVLLGAILSLPTALLNIRHASSNKS